jgi:hypothetical protein
MISEARVIRVIVACVELRDD